MKYAVSRMKMPHVGDRAISGITPEYPTHHTILGLGLGLGLGLVLGLGLGLGIRVRD